MNKEEIIKLAREAGFVEYLLRVYRAEEGIERFAALVAAAEREACAKVCEDATSSIQVGKNVCTNLANAIRARGEK